MAWSVEEKKAETKRTGPGKIAEVQALGKSVGGEGGKARDLGGGMEMLELDFLLGVIENTRGADKNDVGMRRLSFNEVLRREQQNTIDSEALTVYAVDESNLYGKSIQCEAMKELTKRTSQKSKDSG